MDGGLGVPQLECLRLRTLSPQPGAVDPVQWAAELCTIHALGLGLHETLEFLHSHRPSLAEFEAWVIERTSGGVDARQVAEVNARIEHILRREAEPERTLPDGFEPVFDAAELHSWVINGYVVLRDAVPPEGCRAAERALWDFLGMNPSDAESWYRNPHGHTIMVPLVHHPAFVANRRSTRIRAAFAQLWGTDELQVTIDRGGFNPPERGKWRFPGPELHWDTSLAAPIPLGIQGILYLTDTPAGQGAFRCVPGFHRRIEAWLAALPPGTNPRAVDLSAEAVPIAATAGDLVLWHAALPHGASANRGTYPRMVQYIAWYPPGRLDQRPWI